MTESYKLSQSGAIVHVGYRSYGCGRELVEYEGVLLVKQAVQN